MTVQVPSSPKVCFCTTCEERNKPNMRYWNERKTSTNFISPDLWLSTAEALTSVRWINVCGVMQQRVYQPFRNVDEFKKRLLKSRLVWSGIYRRCYQRMEKKHLRACVRSKGRYFEHLLLDKLSAKVTDMTKCALCVLFYLSNHTALK